MSTQFCPSCGIGLSNSEKEVGFCRNCKNGFEISSVICDLCNYSWVAVRPFGVEKLECPHCGNISHFENK